MKPVIALGLIGALLLVTALIGAMLARGKGRRRTAEETDRPDPADFPHADFGRHGTVIQFSTVYCSRCPATRRSIVETLESMPGVGFVDVDVTERPELAARYRLTQTPTVLILDRSRTPLARLSGPLSRAALAAELKTTIGDRR